jgi:hypothetical protein
MMQNVKGKNGIKKGIDRQLALKMARSLPPIETAELEAGLSLKDFLSLWKERLEDYSKDETLEEWERNKAVFQLETLKETFDEDIPSYSPELITEALEKHYSKDFDWALYCWALSQTEGDNHGDRME